MTSRDAIVQRLRALCDGQQRALVDDPQGVLSPEFLADSGLPPAIFARGNLSFRIAWEPRRHSPDPYLIVRQRDETLLPDVEAAAGAARLRLDPVTLLEIITGEPCWPSWVRQEAALVAAHHAEIARLWAARPDAPRSDGAVEELLVQAATGLDLAAHGDPAADWQAFFEAERTIRSLVRERSRLVGRLQNWLRHRSIPLRWIRLDDPSAAMRLTWLVALLLQHREDLVLDLPRLYPGAQPLTGQDATAVARVAYRLERQAPDLAAAQRDEAETVLAGPLRDGLIRALEITQPTGAARVVRRERRSGLLMLWALRSLLGAVALEQAPHHLALEADLANVVARAAQFSHQPAVAAHAELLRSHLRLDRNRARLEELTVAEDEASLVDDVLRHCGAGDAALTDADLALVKAALTDHAVASPGWAPQADANRQKAVLAGLFGQTVQTEQLVHAVERRLGRLLAGQAPPVHRAAAAAFDERLVPLIEGRGNPRTMVVLVAGLSWSVWQRWAPTLHRAYDLEALPLLAPLPTHGPLALRRGLAGMRWRDHLAEAAWDEVLASCRPELGLRRRRQVPRAFERLAEAGAAVRFDTSRPLAILSCDLLAGAPAGLPVGDYQRRLGRLFEALDGLARSGRRDELVVVQAVSGAIPCLDAPGEALPGTSLGPRCLVTTDPGPEGSIEIMGEFHGWPGQRFLVAGGRGRLAPAAAEETVADGGVSFGELVVPFAQLTPVPRGETTSLVVSELVVPAWLTAGEPTELAVYATLTGGALADVVSLTCPDAEPAECHATLDLGEQVRLALSYLPHLPDGRTREDRTLTVICQVGRRRLVRSALVTIRAATNQPAPALSG